MKNKFSLGQFNTRTTVAIGIGTAIFIVLYWFIKIPTPIPEVTFQAASALCAVFACLFGPVAGFLIGFIGHVLTDALSWGGVWWSWALANGLAGFMFGFTYNRTRVEEGTFKGKDILLFNAVQVIANILAWALIAPAGDVVIFKEVPSVVFLQGISSAINNCISTGVIGTLLLVAYAATKTKKGSLSKKNG